MAATTRYEAALTRLRSLQPYASATPDQKRRIDTALCRRETVLRINQGMSDAEFYNLLFSIMIEEASASGRVRELSLPASLSKMLE